MLLLQLLNPKIIRKWRCVGLCEMENLPLNSHFFDYRLIGDSHPIIYISTTLNLYTIPDLLDAINITAKTRKVVIFVSGWNEYVRSRVPPIIIQDKLYFSGILLLYFDVLKLFNFASCRFIFSDRDMIFSAFIKV